MYAALTAQGWGVIAGTCHMHLAVKHVTQIPLHEDVFLL